MPLYMRALPMHRWRKLLPKTASVRWNPFWDTQLLNNTDDCSFLSGDETFNVSLSGQHLLQDTTHLIRRPRYPRGSPCQDPAGNWTTRLWRHAICNGIVMSPVHRVWPKPSCKAQWKGEEDKADKGRGGKTTSGNGQAWSMAGPRGQWRTGKNGENWLRNHLWCPNDPRG